MFISSITPERGDRGNNRVLIAYNVNRGEERDATLTFTTTGGTGSAVEEQFTLTQAAAAPVIAEVTAENTVSSGTEDFLYHTERLVAGATGTISTTITLGGSATGWEAAKDGDTGDAFITSLNSGGTATGGSSTALDLVYTANGGAGERSVTINITPTGTGGSTGVVFPFVLTQLGTAATIAVGIVTDGSGAPITPTGTNNYSVSSTAQTLTVSIELTGAAVNVSHTTTTGDFFTVAKKESPLRYEIAFEANTTAVERDVTLTFEGLNASSTSFGTPITTAITLTQAEDPTTIRVGSVTDAGSTVIAPTGTTYSIPATVQTLTVPIELTGAAVSVSHTATTGDFFTVAKKEAPLRYEIVFEANTTALERDVTLTFEAKDGSDVSFSPAVTTAITITQAAGEDHTFVSTSTYTPELVGGNLTAVGGTISTTFALGGGATGWEATEGQDYVSLAPDNGDGVTPVVVTYDANDTFVARDVVITITTTGPTGVSITDDISIPQEGAQGIEVVTVPADLSDLLTDAGSIDVDVRLLGSATGWSASVAATNPAGFLTLGSTSGGAGSAVLTINYTENTDLNLREGVVTLTATGGRGRAQDTVLTISQLGTGPNLVVRAPTGEDFLALPAAGGTIVAEVVFTGGATGWDAVAGSTNPANFLTVGAKDVANGEQPIAYAENTGVARTGTVTFTTSGGTGAAAVRAVDFRQLGAAPTISVSTNVADLTMIPAAPTGGGATGTITATITLGGGAEGWTVAKSGDDTDAFIESFTPASGDRTNDMLTITYKENTGATRTATLTFTTTGGTGAAATEALVLTQLAVAAATITVGSVTDADDTVITPTGTTYAVSFSAQTLSVPITLTGTAENVDYSPKTGTFLTSVTEQSSPLRYEIVFGANTGAVRSVTLTFEGLDASDVSLTPPVTTEITITQAAARVLRVPDLLSSFRLYPNPANSSFVVETEFSDARISIQHVHGGELLRVSLQRGHNEVDISHLPAGVYVVTLTTAQGSTSTRLIKAE